MKLLVLLISVATTCLGNTLPGEIVVPHLDVKDNAIKHVLMESLSVMESDQKHPQVSIPVLNGIVPERAVKLPPVINNKKHATVHRNSPWQQRKQSRKELRERLRIARLHRKTHKKILKNQKLDKLHKKPVDIASHELSEAIEKIVGKHKDGMGSDLPTDYIKEHIVDISKSTHECKTPAKVDKVGPSHRMLNFPTKKRNGQGRKGGSKRLRSGLIRNRKSKQVKLQATRGKPRNLVTKNMKKAQNRQNRKKKLNRNNKKQQGYVTTGKNAKQASPDLNTVFKTTHHN